MSKSKYKTPKIGITKYAQFINGRWVSGTIYEKPKPPLKISKEEFHKQYWNGET